MIPWVGTLAAAQTPGALSELEVRPEGFRASYDVTVAVLADGLLTFEGEPVSADELARQVGLLAGQGGDLRVVVSADRGASYGRVVEVLDLVQQAGAARAALEVGAAAAPHDPLFPGFGGEVVNLDETPIGDELLGARPRRWRFPQNPYGSTDFTAYTREWGEAKIGLASISYGVLPRTQVGTSAALDALRIWNGQAKVNFLRAGPFDAALAGSLFVVPINATLRRIDADGRYEIGGVRIDEDDIFVDRVTTYGVALQTSLQVAGGWSVHGGVGYNRASARGQLDLLNLPEIVIPGLDPIGGQITIVPAVSGELLDLRFATDYRFNRRDSLIVQAAASVWAKARGVIDPSEISGVPFFDAAAAYDVALERQQIVSPRDSFRATVAWQFSWRRVDLRAGIGVSAVPATWLLQAFDLSYRFGGETRRTERTIRRGYREDKEEQDILEEIEFGAPPEGSVEDP